MDASALCVIFSLVCWQDSNEPGVGGVIGVMGNFFNLLIIKKISLVDYHLFNIGCVVVSCRRK